MCKYCGDHIVRRRAEFGLRRSLLVYIVSEYSYTRINTLLEGGEMQGPPIRDD